MYTAFLWCDFTQRKYRQLEVAYNNVFRRFLGYDKYCSASSMFVENRTDGFDARIRKLVYGFRERLANFWKFPYWNYHKQFSVAFLKIVEFVGEVLIFAINHDFKCTNAAIKTMLCFFIYFVYHILWCCVLCIYTFLSRFQLLIMNEMMIFVHVDRWVICFSPLTICHFPYFCVNYSCCILLYMGSMFIYISLYILWKPAIKTIIIIYIYIYMCVCVCSIGKPKVYTEMHLSCETDFPMRTVAMLNVFFSFSYYKL